MNIQVTGMHCGSCVRTLEHVLGKLDGVEKAKIDFQTEVATIEGQVDADLVLETIREEGYGATLIS